MLVDLWWYGKVGSYACWEFGNNKIEGISINLEYRLYCCNDLERKF
jgi:hypothetical protein